MNILRYISEWFLDHKEVHLLRKTLRYYGFIDRRHGERYPELDRYDDAKGADQKWITVHEIFVETERDKEQLLAASRYIHDLLELDTEYMGVNYIAHLYTDPDLIKVRARD